MIAALRNLRYALLSLALLLAGCFRAHELTDEDASVAVGCSVDAMCDDMDECTVDTCVNGSCAHAPLAFAFLSSTGAGVDFGTGRSVSGYWYGGASPAPEGRVYSLTESDHQLLLAEWGLSDVVNSRFVGPILPSRAWDGILVPTADDVIVVDEGRSWLASTPGNVSAVPTVGLTAEATRVGDVTLLVGDGDADCTLDWMDNTGRLVPGQSFRAPGACLRSRVGSRGLPQDYEGVASRGSGDTAEVDVLAFGADREVHRLVVSRTTSRSEQYLLPEREYEARLAFIGREHAGVMVAQWVEADDVDAPDAYHLRIGAFVYPPSDGTHLQPLAPLIETRVENDHLYSPFMDVRYCSGRYLVSHVGDDDDFIVHQLDMQGLEIAPPIHIPSMPSDLASVHLLCVDGGALLQASMRVASLACNESIRPD